MAGSAFITTAPGAFLPLLTNPIITQSARKPSPYAAFSAPSMSLFRGGRSSFRSGRFGGFSNKNSNRNNKGGRFGNKNNSNGNGNGSGNGGLNASSGSAGDSGKENIFAQLWASYNAALETRPLLTKAFTSLVGFAIGDILAQNFISGKDLPFDNARFARMCLFGFLIHGPTGHFFYGALDRALPGTEAWKVVSKVAIDQILWNPIFGIMFFTFLGALEGKKPDEIKKKIQSDLITAVTGSWKVWPVVHLINFRFIPPSQRMLYINTIQIFYNVFLSFIGNKGQAPAPAPAPAKKEDKKNGKKK